MIPRDVEISVRAPLRLSFAGGGTDLPAYYLQHGGLVVSTAITRYARVTAREPGEPIIRVTSTDYRFSLSWPSDSMLPIEEPLSLPKAAIQRFASPDLRKRGIDLRLRCDVPPGTGLGSSSAMAVALVLALTEYLRIPVTAAEVAEAACEIEIERLGMPIGKQDQYAASFGGLNAIAFDAAGVDVSPLRMDGSSRALLAERLLLFSSGRSRSSAEILRQQSRDSATDPGVTASLHRLKALATRARRTLEAGDLDRLGHMLHEAWMAKRGLSSRVSNPEIDRAYAAARAAGAMGGKLVGAGGGGYLLVYAPTESGSAVRLAMADAGFPELRFDLEPQGARLTTVSRARERDAVSA